MSTRCLIGKKNSNGSVTYVYCHHDGYPEGVGKVLLDYYNDSNIDELFSLGDLSAIGESPISNKDGWENHDYSGKYCLAYKDRGEKNVSAKTINSVEDYLKVDSWQDFWYLLDNNVWYISDGESFLKLSEV